MFCLHVCLLSHVCTVSTKARRGPQYPGTGVINGCEPQCECCRLSPSTMEGQPVALNPLANSPGPVMYFPNVLLNKGTFLKPSYLSTLQKTSFSGINCSTFELSIAHLHTPPSSTVKSLHSTRPIRALYYSLCRKWLLQKA